MKFTIQIKRHNGMMWRPVIEADTAEEAVIAAGKRSIEENIDAERVVSIEPHGVFPTVGMMRR